MTRCFASLPPDSVMDLVALELTASAIAASGSRFVWLTPDPMTALSPFWFHAQLKSEGVTDFIAINRFRDTLGGQLPREVHCHSLVTSLPPEWLAPSSVPRPMDVVSLMNAYALGEAASLPGASLASWPNAAWSRPWAHKNIHILCLADHPSKSFAHALASHPALGKVMQRVLSALEESPAYLSRSQLDLILALSERAEDTHILDLIKRERLLSLIQVHVLGPQNARKTLLDLVRNNPGCPLNILGNGWEAEGELAAYARPTPAPGALPEILSRTRVFILPHAVESMIPGPDLAAVAAAQACPVVAFPDDAQLPAWLKSGSWPLAGDLATLARKLSEVLEQSSATASTALAFSKTWNQVTQAPSWSPLETAERAVRKAT